MSTTFLAPLRSGNAGGLVLRNARSGALVAARLLPALDSDTRRTGLLKHSGLEADEAMVIAPTNAIHTFFMKFAIDVAFVRRDGQIVKIRAAMPAWRMSAAWGGYAVIEMAAGSFARVSTVAGDVLRIERDENVRTRRPGF
jgi:uncharacterized membrane protein (UPF0127 family)